VLHWARASGLATGVVTSKGRGMTTRSLQHVGLLDAFDVIVTADDTPRHKPDPLPVRHALEQLGLAPERALFVGDSTHDMHAGRGAGTYTGAALWGPFSREALAEAAPTHWLADMRDVPDAVEPLLARCVERGARCRASRTEQRGARRRYRVLSSAARGAVHGGTNDGHAPTSAGNARSAKPSPPNP
jgi:beta-phosphoglucomutase-like phosphatase (HAD superfamily)